MTLREAAQALDAELMRGGYLDAGRGTPRAEDFYQAWQHLRAQLALPPSPDRWTEGWEAGRRAAHAEAEAEEREYQSHADDLGRRGATAAATHDVHGALGCRAVKIRIAALPVPAATTGEGRIKRDRPVRWGDLPSWTKLLDAMEANEKGTQPQRARPKIESSSEAKTAESEVGWILRLKARHGDLREWTPRETYAAAEAHRSRLRYPDDWEIVRVRITAEPAPVEPEEMHR